MSALSAIPQSAPPEPVSASASESDFLAGGGELGERMRQHDWAGTPLGPVTSWPQSLLTAVRIMLGSRYELASRLRGLPHLGQVTLVALTGYGQSEDLQRTRAAGFDFHLVKPVDPDDLRRTLASVSVRA